MARDQSAEIDREERLGAVLAEYREAEREGRAPSRDELVRLHPEIATELLVYFADKEFVERLTEPMRPDLAPTARRDEATADHELAHEDLVDLHTGPTAAAGSCNESEEAASLLCGTVFGDYELRELIGLGGMGAVYRARQISRDRVVAVKTILKGLLASEEDVRRFRFEFEAASKLDHPNIVAIHDAGRHEGRDFFSMKFIEGSNLAKCQRRFQSDPKCAARLMAKVARAIHHAHQRGILHRDLKPSNILVDQRDQPYVSDFGLAKRISDAVDLTQPDTTPGTPRWMAPEQASGAKGAVTTATDIHGFGTILYFLLTGRAPFDARSVFEVLNQIKTRIPDPPRQRNPRIDRELETICLKCLEKEPTQRYHSALALAEDLERWLDGKPIKVRPVGPVVTAWRWARRNRLVASLMGVVGVLLLAGLVGLIVATAVIARKNVEITRERNRARAAVNKWFTQFAEQELSKAPGMEKTRREFLLDALTYYETEVAEGNGSDPASQVELANATYRVGRILNMLSEVDRSGQAYARAVPLLERLMNQFPREPSLRELLARSLTELGLAFWTKGRMAEAGEAFRRGFDTAELGATAFPERREFRLVMAANLHNMAVVRHGTGQLKEADTAYRRAIALREKLTAEYPDDAACRHDLAGGLGQFGTLLEDIRRPRLQEAEGTFRHALDIEEKLAAEFPARPEYLAMAAAIRNNLGDFLVQRGRLNEAEQVLRQALSEREQLASRYPDLPDHRANLGLASVSLGECLRDQGKYAEVSDLANRAITHLQAALNASPKHPAYLGWLVNDYVLLAETLLSQGDLAKASEFEEAAIKVLPDAWESYCWVAAAYARCIPRLEKHPKLKASQRRALAHSTADRAAELLRMSIKKGYRLTAKLLQDEPTYDPLHPFESFQRLIKELDGK